MGHSQTETDRADRGKSTCSHLCVERGDIINASLKSENYLSIHHCDNGLPLFNHCNFCVNVSPMNYMYLHTVTYTITIMAENKNAECIIFHIEI